MTNIIMNRIKCKLCGDIIVSKHRHDFVKCKCGEVFADGGNEYLRWGATDLNNIINLSIVEEDVVDINNKTESVIDEPAITTTLVRVGSYSSPTGIFVRFPRIKVYFSYETCIGFSTVEHGLVVCKNYWGTTTGKHLNAIDGGSTEAKKKRLSKEEFRNALQRALADLGMLA